MMSNGEYFISEGISLKEDEVAADWWDTLSDDEYMICKKWY